MCLAVPGKVTQIGDRENDLLMGKVSFGGLVKEVCLSYVPDVKVGEYVIVHVGFALSKVDEDEANRVFEYLDQMGEVDELRGGQD